jgi:hypothetical protein
MIRELIRKNGPYDLVMDLHESKKYGYFIYQYLPPGPGLGEEYTRILRDLGKPAQESYREGIFRARGGVLRIPAAALPWIAAAGRLSLEHYARLHGTDEARPIKEGGMISDPLFYIRRQMKWIHPDDLHLFGEGQQRQMTVRERRR